VRSCGTTTLGKPVVERCMRLAADAVAILFQRGLVSAMACFSSERETSPLWPLNQRFS
jgi:hypothetical protein